jgi:adenylate cyclase
MKARTTVLLAIIIAGLAHTTASAQSTLPKAQHDSLWAVWSDPAQADTNRLNAMSDLAWYGYLKSQPDSAYYYAQLKYDLAARKGLKKQMAAALTIQGASFQIRGDYAKALDHHQRALMIREEIGDKKGVASSLNNLGLVYHDQGDFARALEHQRRSLKINEEIGDKQSVAKNQKNIGQIYAAQNDYPQALDHYLRGWKVLEEIDPSILTDIGNLYSGHGDHPKALEYHQRALKINEDIGDKRQIANSLGNIGLHYSQGDHSKALDHYQRALMIFEEIGDKIGIAKSLGNIGIVHSYQGDHPRALDHYQKSLKISEELGMNQVTAYSYKMVGDLKNKDGNHPEALAWCEKGLKLAEEMEVIHQQKEACKCLYDAYKAMGQGNKALVYLEKIGELDKQLNKEETAKKLQQMEFKQVMLQDSIAKAEEARLVQEAHQEEVRKSTRTRNVFAVSGTFLLLLAGGLYSRARYMRRSKAVLQVEKDRSENLLLNILPAEIAEELKQKGRCEARDFDKVSIIFTDFKDFTEHSAAMSAAALVNEINHCFEAFDGIMAKYGIEKIKTIGDAYMAAGGLPVPMDGSVKNTVLAALEMQRFIKERKVHKDALGEPAFEMRVGIHTGPVVAGIVGVKKFQYDIWGDTVNVASRMESGGVVGQVNISESTYRLLKDDPRFGFSPRGKVEAKGKGELEMFIVQEKETSSVGLEERPLESTTA